MTSKHLTTLNLEPFLRNTIGLDRIFENMMPRIDQLNSTNYPPYNIIALDNDNYVIEVAVAGFTKDEITVTTKDGTLTIEGKHVDKTEDENLNYLHRGISSRAFKREFALADYVEVEDAKIEDGILKISLKRELPESMKPKRIEVK